MEFASTPFNCAPPSFRSPLAPFREAPRGQGAILQRARTDHRSLITDHRPERRPPFDLASKQSFCGRTRRPPPPERVLVEQLEVSRSTLRESLRILADNRLIQVRPGVGTYVRVLDRSNFAEANALAQGYRQAAGAPPEASSAPAT